TAIESRCGAGTRVEHERSNERRRAISVLMEQVRQIRHRLAKGSAEVAHAMKGRIGARQDGGMRDSRDRRLRVRAREDDRGASEGRGVWGAARGSTKHPPPARGGGWRAPQEGLGVGVAGGRSPPPKKHREGPPGRGGAPNRKKKKRGAPRKGGAPP